MSTDKSMVRCPKCGRKTCGEPVDGFFRKAIKKGIGYSVGSAIGSMIVPGLGSAIGGAIGTAIQCTPIFGSTSNSLTNMVSDPDYRYRCTCGHKWTYSNEEVKENHDNMIKNDALKIGALWSILLTGILVWCIHFWWFDSFFSDASWLGWTLSIIGEIAFFIVSFFFIFIANLKE